KNVAYGYLVTSTIARGEVRAMDVSAAEKSPGVVAIYTPFRSLKLYRGLTQAEGANSGEIDPPIQDNKIRYYGQIIGLVVADSFEQARDAAALVKVDYAPDQPIASWEAGLKNAFPPTAVDGQKPTVAILADGVSSIDDAIQKAEVVVDATYTEPIHHHNPMEPHATTAVWDGNRLTTYDATQFVSGQQPNVAAILGVNEDDVRVICPFIGGGFGSKQAVWTHSPLTAAAARALNRPIKTVLTREQMFTLAGHRPALIQRVSLAANRDGVLQAVKHDVHSTVGFAGIYVEAAAQRTSRFVYKSPNIQVSQTLVPLHVGAPTSMRAPGESPGMFALECAMDELAVKLAMDPIELRMRNYAEIYPGRNVPYSSKTLAESYRLGAERFGWSRRNPKPGSIKNGDWLVGMGMATAVYPAHRRRSSAKVRLQADGSAEVSLATQDLGTGMWTVVAIVGAQSLGLPIERVRPYIGDSALPPAPVAGGSQSTASVAPAIQKAAESAKAKLIQIAVRDPKSPFNGMSDLSYENGQLVGGEKREEFGAVLNAIGRGSVEATETAASGDEQEKYAFYSFGAQFCEVEVHRWTCEIRVKRVTSVMDIGTVVNPKTARSQVIGGIVFGIGMALLEGSHLEEKTGRYANGNFADYLVATNADVPYIDLYFIGKPDTIFNSVGARGAGEIGVTGIPAAIANAVYNATGQRVRDFPITLDKLLLPSEGNQRALVDNI
ncbi:MAG TPA: xanthine dehydrogenase family protein molybdopterin-binding subunit, partial [Chthoniobacterales bacterium]|nr:xanthine dehydrogenase family protein molybdopterin-binding subunit [Chthoniobacterales bacterium]